MHESADVFYFSSEFCGGVLINAVCLELGLEVILARGYKVYVAVFKNGNLLVALDRLNTEDLAIGNLFVIGGIKTASEIIFKESVNAIKCTAHTAAGNKELFADCFNDKSLVTELCCVELTVSRAVGVADKDFVFAHGLRVGLDGSLNARDLSDVAAKLTRCFHIGICRFFGADDGVFRDIILYKHESILLDDERCFCFFGFFGGFGYDG